MIRRLPCNVALLVLFGGSIIALRADVIFSDFGPSNESNSTTNGEGWCVSGNTTSDCGPQTDRWIAAPFTPSGNFTLTQIDLALGYDSGTNGAVIELVNSTSGLPGTTVLESWRPTSLSSSCAFCAAGNPRLTLDSTGSVQLENGTQYWLVAEGINPSTLDFWWGNVNALTGVELSLNDGTSWIVPGDGNLTAFDVQGTPSSVAEPSYEGLVTFGLCIVLVAIRRHRTA
jgi:hypothetical protein